MTHSSCWCEQDKIRGRDRSGLFSSAFPRPFPRDCETPTRESDTYRGPTQRRIRRLRLTLVHRVYMIHAATVRRFLVQPVLGRRVPFIQGAASATELKALPETGEVAMSVLQDAARSDRNAFRDGPDAGAAPGPRDLVRQAHRAVCRSRDRRRTIRIGLSHSPAHRVWRRSRVTRARRGAAIPLAGQTTAARPPAGRILTCLALTVVAGLGFLAIAKIDHWDTHHGVVWLGLLLIAAGGAVCENAITLAHTRSPSEPTPMHSAEPLRQDRRGAS